MKLHPLIFLMTVIATLLLSVLSTDRAIAQSVSSPAPTPPHQTPAYQVIGRDVAAESAVEVQVAPGRTTTIDFSQTDEAINYVLIADPSRIVYTTNAELESGQAKTLFLRTIQALNFPGATRTQITNLSVQTVDSNGQQRLYNFSIVPVVATPRYIGVSIVNAVAGRQTLIVSGNRTATLSDIETGLRIAIQRGYADRNDPIVSGVQQLLTLVRNDNVTIQDAATTVNIPLAVISELARIALDERLLTPVTR
jgi:hypothetical protein